MRLTSDGPVDPALAAGGVKRRIAAAAALPDCEALAREIGEARAVVREVFHDVLGGAKRR